MKYHNIILNFHGIGDIEREYEPGEQPYWISRKLFQEIIDLISNHRDRDRVQITFDDGNSSDAEIAMPYLTSKNLTASFFVLSRKLNMQGYLSRGNLNSLLAAGMEIGTHGADHVNWRSLNQTALRAEIIDARKEIETTINRPITKAAIPFGSYNKAVLNCLRDEKYETVFTSDGGAANASSWLQPRTSIRCDSTANETDTLIRNGVGIFNTARRNLKMKIKEFL